ncbi:MAG: hypothetical protein JOZ18_11700 [Chloroflexi bacterium]|nr:hypothetical protein [Chloroflexota bacterium]
MSPWHASLQDIVASDFSVPAALHKNLHQAEATKSEEYDIVIFGSLTKKADRMKYYVTYCITHPAHTPTTATGMVEARTRPDLEVRLARGVEKWKKQGYTIEIVKIGSVEDVQNTTSQG